MISAKIVRTVLYHLYFYNLIGLETEVGGLHLGSGGFRIAQFVNIDTKAHSHCDVIANVWRLKLRSKSVPVIYTSHVFEHLPATKTIKAISEWYRVLKPGGQLYICVPDLEALFEIYLKYLPAYGTADGRHRVDLAHGIIFGGQVDKYDYHYSGYSMTTLKALLLSVGFRSVERFDPSKLGFAPRDASYAEICDEPVSLNLQAIK